MKCYDFLLKDLRKLLHDNVQRTEECLFQDFQQHFLRIAIRMSHKKSLYQKTDRKSRSLNLNQACIFKWCLCYFHRPKIVLVEPRKKVSFYYFYLDYQLRQTLGSSVGFFFCEIGSICCLYLGFLASFPTIVSLFVMPFFTGKNRSKMKERLRLCHNGENIFMMSYLTSYSFAITYINFKTRIDHKFQRLKQK